MLFPACAGMNRNSKSRKGHNRPVPRMRGDEPPQSDDATG